MICIHTCRLNCNSLSYFYIHTCWKFLGAAWLFRGVDLCNMISGGSNNSQMKWWQGQAYFSCRVSNSRLQKSFTYNVYLFKWFMNHDVSSSKSMIKLKALLRMNILNDVTAALFSVLFYSWQLRKNTKNGAAVTSIGTFVHRYNFIELLEMRLA